MITTSKKITKVNTTVSWRKHLKTDDGKIFATMSATIDERRPLGTVSLSVIDDLIYVENADVARNTYENFQKEVFELAKTMVVSSASVEEI